MAIATTNLHLRIAPAKKSLLLKAAEATHASTLTEYVLSSALRQAELDLLERQTFSLKPKDWDAFNRRLDSPPRELSGLKALFAAGDAFHRPA